MGTLRDPSTINNVGTLGGATNPTTAQALPLERENQKAIRELVGTFGYEDLTISSGGITPTKAEVTVDTEAGASTDDLTTIYLVSDGTTTLHDGMILKLRAYDPARTVTVKHGSGVNQIQTVSGTDIVLGTTWELTLKLQSGVWKEVRGRQDITGNAATATDLASGHVLHGANTASEVRTAVDVYSKAEVDASLVAAMPVGMIFDYAGNAAPSGALICDGSARSRTAYADLFAALVTSAGFTTQTFTVTVASPAVCTKESHGFVGGERLRLSSTGALPTGLNTTSDYFVEVINANTFYLTTAGGTRINTSGTQSGTHSYLQSLHGLGDGLTTFNLPDLRGEFRRGADLGRGVDSGRAVASLQRDAIRNISGSLLNSDINDIGIIGTNATDGVVATGAFFKGAVTTRLTSNQAGTGYRLGFNASLVVPTASENRPRNIAVVPCIKY